LNLVNWRRLWDDGIRIYRLVGSSITFNNNQIASGQLIFFVAINFVKNGDRRALLRHDA
jgi:hypothetical protein